MKRRDDPEVAVWLEKVRRDLAIADFAAKSENEFWDQACFHAQQAAEKALKALCVASGCTPSRSHDLVFLLHVLGDIESFPGSLREAARLLSQHAVHPRYPSFLAPETEDEARTAVLHAQRIVEFVEETLGD